MTRITMIMRRASLSLAVVFAVILSFSLPVRAIDIKVVESSSGVSAWLVEDHTIPLVSMRFSFGGGSAADPADKQGMAQFLSGMLDEGAGDLSSQDFQRRAQDLAMRLSFDADRDVFSGSFSSLKDNLDDSLEMLKLALTKPRFDDVPMQRIRKQLVLSVRHNDEDPGTIANEAWLKSMVGDHAYAKPVAGTRSGLEAVSADDLKALVTALFARDNLKVAVVGAISEAELKRHLDNVFGSLPEKNAMPVIEMAELQPGPVQQVIDREIPQSVIRFGHRGILRDDPDFLAAFVMNHILGGGGFGSRLVTEVREKRGLTYSIYSTLYPLDAAGMFFGGVSTVNDRVSETLDVLRAELKSMAEQGPSAKELDEAKTFLTGSYALRFDSSGKIAAQLLGIQRQKLGLDYVATRNDKINALTLEDMKRVAKRLLQPGNLVITIVGRPKEVENSDSAG